MKSLTVSALLGRRAGALRAAALAASAAASPAAAAVFTLEDGATLDGGVAELGSRYLVVAEKSGAYYVVSRAALRSVRVDGLSGDVEGSLAGWSDDGFLIETPSGLVRVLDVAPQNEAGTRIELTQVEDAGALAEGAEAPDAPTASDEAAARISLGDLDIYTMLAAAARAVPPEPRASEATAARDATPTTSEALGFGAPSQTASNLLIPLDSPTADRAPDGFQIQTTPPATATTPPRIGEAPTRQTAAAARPRSPRTPNLAAPSMATPQLSFAGRQPTTPPALETPDLNAPDVGLSARPGARSSDAAAETGSVQDPANEAGSARIPDAPPSSEAGPLEGGVIEAQLDRGGAADGAAVFEPSFAEDGADADAPVELVQSDGQLTPGLDLETATPESHAAGVFEEHKMGVRGPSIGREGRISCAALGALVSSPRPIAEGRAYPGALTIEIGPDAPGASLRLIVERFLATGPETDGVSLEGPDPSIAFMAGPAEPRLALPSRIVGLRVSDVASDLAAGAGDLAIVGGLPPEGAFEAGRARLIGFDALVFVANDAAPQEALSASDLSSLFLGRLDDWSMVDPMRSGPALTILPPDGAPSLITVLDYAGARRARPGASRRMDGALERAQAAQTVSGAVALTTWSASDGQMVLPIGAGEGVRPSLDTLRSGAYPLPWPIYVVLPEEPTHASAAVLFEYLSSPDGQRAVFDAGLTPVAACDPSTCTLSAVGLTSAREWLASPPRFAPLVIGEPARVSGPVVASFSAPSNLSARSDAFVDELAGFIASVEPGADLLETRLRVVVRAGPAPGTSAAAQAQRAENGLARAESAALALRCAGLQVEEVVLDPSPVAEGGDLNDRLVIELTPQP